MPEFKTEGQKKVYDKLAEMLRDQFGKQAIPNEKEPSFGLRSGSAYAQVGVWPISDKYTVVRAYSWVVTGAETTPELTRFLLEENFGMRFGCFMLEPGTGDILFSHAIVGEGMDTDELMFMVMAVIQTADEYDDKIVQRFGGQRAVDRH